MELSKKARGTMIQKSLETREKFPISYFDLRKYIQHNVRLEDGLGPILQFMDDLPADCTKVTVCRESRMVIAAYSMPIIFSVIGVRWSALKFIVGKITAL